MSGGGRHPECGHSPQRRPGSAPRLSAAPPRPAPPRQLASGGPAARSRQIWLCPAPSPSAQPCSRQIGDSRPRHVHQIGLSESASLSLDSFLLSQVISSSQARMETARTGTCKSSFWQNLDLGSSKASYSMLLKPMLWKLWFTKTWIHIHTVHQWINAI